MIIDKIKSREELEIICRELRSKGKTVGFTSGAFDLLHAGHVDYLEKAKALCDVLIVGVNSDVSVKRYKGPGRPIVDEKQRVKVVAALESVDYVFLFDERRNQQNIRSLKPRFYIKAGDYRAESLTSKDEVEKWGGEIRLIPISEDTSTTQILDRFIPSDSNSRIRFVEKDNTAYIDTRSPKSSPAVFLDRDGTINEEILYLHEPDKFSLLPGSLDGIKKFQDMGYRIVIVSNQPGIGMGYYAKEDFYSVNRTMLGAFSKAGITIDKIYFCPHSKSEKCTCRKPGQALIERAKEELNLDLSRSYFIGDKTSDIETGKRAGMKTILINAGFKGEDGEYKVDPDYRADNLLDAAKVVLSLERMESKDIF